MHIAMQTKNERFNQRQMRRRFGSKVWKIVVNPALPNRREALIISSWPQTSLPKSTDFVKRFENLQALTRAIRNARAEYSVEPAKLITASIVGSEEVIQYISEEEEVLALLSKLDLDNIHFADSPPEDANNQFTLLQVKDWRHIFPLLLWLIFLLKCNALPSAPIKDANGV